MNPFEKGIIQNYLMSFLFIASLYLTGDHPHPKKLSVYRAPHFLSLALPATLCFIMNFIVFGAVILSSLLKNAVYSLWVKGKRMKVNFTLFLNIHVMNVIYVPRINPDLRKFSDENLISNI